LLKRPAHAVSARLQVQFHDCDPLAVVWHGRYFEYMEVSRSQLLKNCRLDVPDMIELGLRMFVTEVRCHYSFPLSYGDDVEVTSWFSERSPLLRVSYDIRNLTKGRKAARAHTRLALTDARGYLLPELPDAVRERLPT